MEPPHDKRGPARWRSIYNILLESRDLSLVAQHRMPIPGLWQTGGTTHPGGSITGYPGRNAAKVILSDIGIDPSNHMS